VIKIQRSACASCGYLRRQAPIVTQAHFQAATKDNRIHAIVEHSNNGSTPGLYCFSFANKQESITTPTDKNIPQQKTTILNLPRTPGNQALSGSVYD
jgi:hypothetical protein